MRKESKDLKPGDLVLRHSLGIGRKDDFRFVRVSKVSRIDTSVVIEFEDFEKPHVVPAFVQTIVRGIFEYNINVPASLREYWRRLVANSRDNNLDETCQTAALLRKLEEEWDKMR